MKTYRFRNGEGFPFSVYLRGGVLLEQIRTVKFMVTEWNAKKFAIKVELYSKQDDCELVGTGENIDPFNGRTKYIAVFRKKVKC
jgi:hypothetical protein